MRHVDRLYIDLEKPSKLKEASTFDLLQDIINMGNADLVKSTIYRASYSTTYRNEEGNKSHTIDALNKFYNYKCAYCESIEALDVEHYRPKGKITNIDNSVISNTGYYWLAYEWSNLIPACNKCNREGGKNSKFPYQNNGNTRVQNPSLDNQGKLELSKCLISNQDFINELPLLLNPETENSFLNYFSFKNDVNLKGIEIEGKDSNGKGSATIIICKLNRESLSRNRYVNVIHPFIKSLKAIFVKTEQGLITHSKLKEEVYNHFEKLFDNIYDEELPYTLLTKYILFSTNNFNQIVLPYLPKDIRTIVQIAFSTYYKHNFNNHSNEFL